jgi:phage gp36-like protein
MDNEQLDRRVEALESQMRDLHKVAKNEMEKMVAANYKIPLSPAPDELVRHCAKVYIQVLTGLDPSVHEIRHTEEAMRRALEHAAAWRGEGSE